MSPILDPAVQCFLDSVPTDGPDCDFRNLLSRLQALPVGRPAATIQDVTLPTGPTGAVRASVVRPKARRALLPVVMFFHGGGWVAGDRATHDRLIREIAVNAEAAVVFVDYDRSPEARYPLALEQAYAATLHVAGNGPALGLDTTRLAVLGDGAGGTIAAAVALLAKQRRGPRITCQVLLYPVTDAGFDTPSYRDFADGPWLTRAAMLGFWDAYIPDIGARGAITAAPLRASVEALGGLPETLVIVAKNDVVRDEGEAYARKLLEAGVRVTSVRYHGTIHDFVLLNSLADMPAARSAIAQVAATLNAAFA